MLHISLTSLDLWLGAKAHTVSMEGRQVEEREEGGFCMFTQLSGGLSWVWLHHRYHTHAHAYCRSAVCTAALTRASSCKPCRCRAARISQWLRWSKEKAQYFDNWLTVLVIFQLLKCEDLLLSFVFGFLLHLKTSLWALKKLWWAFCTIFVTF